MNNVRGTLTLVFDDGYTEVYEQVLPLLRKHGLRAVFAIPVRTDTVMRKKNTPMTALAEWKDACLREGHELAAHGVTHRPLTELPDDELADELRQARDLTGATTLVYPGGTFDKRVQRAAARYFAAARSVRWGVETLPPRDPFALQTLNATRRNFRWAKYRPREIFALMTRGWIIETFHRITDDPAVTHGVTLRDFTRHLRWLSILPLRVATIRDIISPTTTHGG